jgi:hypothetical protein
LYTVIAAILGRDVLAQLDIAIANDAGDPLLNAAILHWNAQHVPWSDAWWQFPIYYPTRDTLTFSEHLLGLSVIASPIAWITGNPLTAYNLTTLLTFPLSAVSMYALVYRLTGSPRQGGSAAAAFLAGLAFGFAPYRMSQLPHLQMLATFWAPLSLLGLHGYIETRRRRWLALYGAAWALQGAANGYTLVLFSVLVGLWVVWFVVARRDWRALGMIALATFIAALPLAPILYKYVTVHAYYGLERSLGEVRMYSADVAAVLCAPSNLAFWGWVRVACRGEGELFPGVALFVVSAAALYRTVRGGHPGRPLVLFRRLLLAVAVVYALIVASVLVAGPWRIDVGFIHVSASDIDKPLLISLAAAVAALLITLGANAATRPGSTIGFYLFAAVAAWLLALGPMVTFMGEPSGRPGPFMLLQALPGVGSLRVPARFWLMTVMCLTTAAGLFLADVLRSRARHIATAVVLIAGCALLADGWIARVPAQAAPQPVPDPTALAGNVVLQLPIEPFPDVASTWRAVTGGWKTVNGYSGYGPNYYEALTLAARAADDALFPPLQRDHELHVVVANDALALKAAVERQPGVVLTARAAGSTQYRLPRRPADALEPGRRLPITSVRSACASADVGLMVDGNERNMWECLQPAGAQELTIDLGAVAPVGSMAYSLGPFFWNVPTELLIETSHDGISWSTARRGSVLGEFIEGGLNDPASLRALLRFEPREARYVRLRPVGQPENFAWFVAELEIRAP